MGIISQLSGRSKNTVSQAVERGHASWREVFGQPGTTKEEGGFDRFPTVRVNYLTSFRHLLNWGCKGCLNCPSQFQSSIDYSLVKPKLFCPFTDSFRLSSKSNKSPSNSLVTIPDSSGSFWRPASRDSCTNKVLMNSTQLRPFSQAVSLISYSYHAVASCISSLFFSCCPTAILRTIITVIINAFYCMCRRGFWPHIGQEIPNTCPPSLANLYPPTSISGISYCRWIVTSVTHVYPSIVLAWEQFSQIAFGGRYKTINSHDVPQIRCDGSGGVNTHPHSSIILSLFAVASLEVN